MGHDRTGMLPKTHRWRRLVHDLTNLYVGEQAVADIACSTLQNVRARFKGLMYEDASSHAAFEFLVLLAVVSRSPQAQATAEARGLSLPPEPTPLALVQALQSWMAGKGESLEYRDLSQAAAADALASWYSAHRPEDTPLFGPAPGASSVWRRAGDGSGFCELARRYFGALTERYLRYFLEREASGRLPSLADRDRFEEDLTAHVDDVSRHAFETAKIAQSFAAGWFSKHASGALPSGAQIRAFMRTAFGKLREELLREGTRP